MTGKDKRFDSRNLLLVVTIMLIISFLRGTGGCAQREYLESVSRKMDVSSTKTRIIRLPVSTSKVFVTPVVPDYSSGKEIIDYKTTFNPKTINAKDGEVTLEVTSIPIIVEEAIENGRKTSDIESSPFGFLGVGENYDENLPYLKDIGVKWVRYAGRSGIVWDIVEPEKERFNWYYNDSLYLKTSKDGINMVITILNPSRWDRAERDGRRPSHRLPRNIDAYKNFLKKVVERYNGDGIDDAPGSPVIKYWQIQNEPDIFWRDTPEDFARFLKISYQVIKEYNKNAKVVLAGVGMPSGVQKFYIPMLKHLNKIKDGKGDRYFDIFDLHWIEGGTGGYKTTKGLMDERTNFRELIKHIRESLDLYGYNNVPIWITEMASYDGKPRNRRINFPFESERDYASELFKRYIYPLSLGVEKIFWVSLIEWQNFDGEGVNGYFDSVGLINNPRNDGSSHKKIAYYTYKLMVEKLNGTYWNKMKTLELGKDIFAYRLIKNSNIMYVIWVE